MNGHVTADEDVARRVAEHLEEFGETLDEYERLLLHRMIWLNLDPVDRARFGARAVRLSAEQEALVLELEQQSGT